MTPAILNGVRTRPAPIRNGRRSYGPSTFVDVSTIGSSELLGTPSEWLRAQLGGTAARSLVSYEIDGERIVQTFSQGGSRADPTTYIPALAGATNRFVSLGSGYVTPDDVAEALRLDCIAMGVAATRAANVVSIPGASSPIVGDAPAEGAAGPFGRWGMRRIWASGMTTTANLGTAIRYVQMPATAGIVTGLLCHGSGGYRPRLAIGRPTGAFPNPGAITDIREGRMASGLASAAAGVVVLDNPLPFAANEVLVILDCAGPATGTLSIRNFGLTPVGNGNFVLNQGVLVDQARTNPATLFGSSWTPGALTTVNTYDAHAVIFECTPYRRNGQIQPTWYGSVRPATAGGGAAATPLVPAGGSDWFRSPAMQANRIRATRMRIAMNVASALENISAAMYVFGDLAYPTAAPGPFLGGATIQPTVSGAFADAACLIELGREVLGANAIVGLGNCGGALAGGAPSLEQLLFDTAGSPANYTGAWPDNADPSVFNDFVANYLALTQYLVTTSLGGAMPGDTPNPNWPANFLPNASDQSFGNIARMAYLLESSDPGFTAVERAA